jgi:mono/diheme cytochrome c family protein
VRSAILRILAFATTLLAMAAVAAACSVPGTSTLDDDTEPIDQDAARQLFQTTCRACHALSDAKAAGVFGPDLDLLQPDATVVRRAIEDGPGPMPDDLLTGDDADVVARYVAEVAGANLDQEGAGGTRGNATPSTDDE